YDGNWHYTAYMDQLILPATVHTVRMPSSFFKEITFAGTKVQWAQVSCELRSLQGTGIICSDGELLPARE
ncbi:MAG: hypothetical protein J6V39_02095, partial [Clostridia bacterium]|nr:hypothetical protein [Clostridia bacterium]